MRIRNSPAVAYVLGLATVIHIDWHLARPAHHHRLSLGWHQHWIFAAAGFAIVGWLVARTWPERTWSYGAWIAAAALVIAQAIEPILEDLIYAHRLRYAGDPGRWAVFGLCIATGLPVYAAMLWLGRIRRQQPAANIQ